MATGGIAVAQDHAHVDSVADTAVQAPAAAMRKVRWSDASAWPNGRVPAAGDAVTIARDNIPLLCFHEAQWSAMLG
jgi:hypothetical protein